MLAFNDATLKLRDLQLIDINPLSDYWYRSPPGFLESMAVDPGNLMPEAAFRQHLTDRVTAPKPWEEQPSCLLIIEYGGKAIGCHNLTDIRYGEEGTFHAHIWEPAFRRVGLGSYTYPRACRLYMQRFSLKRILFHTPKINPGPNRLKEKLGIRLIGETITKNPIVKAGTIANVFELTAAELAAMPL